MGFGQAVSTCFQKYATFSGRARRSEFWWWQLFVILLGAVANIGDNVLGWHYAGQGSTQVGWLATIVGLLLVLPSIAVLFRRLHDTGRSGWWWLLSWVCCIGTILLWIFCLSDSNEGANQYGPSPKAV